MLLLTPLAVGAVEPWGYAAAEALIAVLFALWMVSGAAGTLSASRPLAGMRALIVLLILPLGLAGFQLIPLPPAVLRVISPATFRLYQESLPGWPDRPSEVRPSGRSESAAPTTLVLPTIDEAAAGAPVPFTSRAASAGRARPRAALESASIRVWRTVSISPSLTRTALLKLVSYACLFILVAGYPFDPRGEARSLACLLQACLLAGAMVALFALLERAYSNGRVLWLFQPWDWREGEPWGTRAVGSFANPDHLANYLGLILPLAIVGTLRPSAIARRDAWAARWMAGGALLLSAAAILLSSSRAGWAAGAAGVLVLAALWPRESGTRVSFFGKIATLAGAGLFLLLVALMVGPQGRAQVDWRLKETLADTSLAFRLGPAFSSLAMIRSFPLFGIGLGCWPELFPRFAPPPWTPIFWNAAHNDYVQLACEMGLVGLALGAWLSGALVLRLRRAMAGSGIDRALVAAAALAAMSAAAVHEFFDFPLQTPANALLLTVLAALALRCVRRSSGSAQPALGIGDTGASGIIYGAGALAAGFLLIAVLVQNRIPYPYDLRAPADSDAAYAGLNAHPASARVHLMLAAMLEEPAALQQLRTAVALDPGSPLCRDLYAQALLGHGDRAEALRQITQSVRYAPVLANHSYLRSRFIPWLSDDERKAVEDGFRLAVAHGYQFAVENFASYYDRRGELGAEAALFEAAARGAVDLETRSRYLIGAGVAYANGGQLARAESALRAAAAATPSDSAPYQRLIFYVYVPRKDMAAARASIAQAIARGADPHALYLALGRGARIAGDYPQAMRALRKAESLRPNDFETVMELGMVEMADKRPEQAARWFGRATVLGPDSAEAFYRLGLADEAAYAYFAADRAYRTAIRLAPHDTAVRRQYAAFRQRVAQNATSAR